MPHPTILAQDLGTTGNKITLFDAKTGVTVTSAFEPYPTAYPHPNWAKQDPADWRRAVIEGTRRVLAAAAGQTSTPRDTLAHQSGAP